MSETLNQIDEQALPQTKRPITEAQRAARRANARKSTGPRTAEGKFRSSLNALRHGAYAKSFVLKTEDQGRFQTVIDDYLANFAPQSFAELEFIEQMAMASWRRRRIATVINEKINQAIDTVLAQAPATLPEMTEKLAKQATPPPPTPTEFTICPVGDDPIASSNESTPEPEAPSTPPKTNRPQPPSITPEALTELAYQHIAQHQPSFPRLESAERLAAASFRAAFRGLQNFRAFLDEQAQREKRRNEATDSALSQAAGLNF